MRERTATNKVKWQNRDRKDVATSRELSDFSGAPPMGNKVGKSGKAMCGVTSSSVDENGLGG